MALKTDLVSYWKLEEASGTRVDAHGSNDLTDNNTVPSATGISGDGADFEVGNSEYLSITDASQSGLDITGDIACSFWFKPESAPSATTWNLVTKWYNANPDKGYVFQYRESSGKKLQFIVSASGSDADVYTTTSTDLGTGAFKHVVISWDASASECKFYVEGALHQTITGSLTSIKNNTAKFLINALDGGSIAGFGDGVMDEVAIWSRTVSLAEVEEIYASGSGKFYDDWDAAAGGTAFSQAIVIS